MLKIVGAWLAVVLTTEVFKLRTGTGDPLVGRMMKFDARAATCVAVPLRRDPRTERPAELTAAEPFFGLLSPEAAEAARQSTLSAEEL
ncbi:hypothetical protein [Streptomyces sp. C36]|uniref:hypothetical protein n=1 Tax=Streptomyces sp. C36 TaxID=3237122 RepID=UPI0034C5DDD7